MAAQEFSSPGAHMSGSDTGSSSSSSSGHSAVIYAPSVDTGSSNARSYRDELYEANDYNRGNYDSANSYNYSLYTNALDWYERMQNTSIQRMVEDMKKAGINPVLAGKYGGYNVSMPNVPYNNNIPYLDVSSLGSYESSHLSSVVSYINNQDDIDATSKNIAKQLANALQIALQNNQTSKDNTKLSKEIDVAINDAKNKNEQHLQFMKDQNQITTTEMNNKTSTFNTLISSIFSVISSGLGTIGKFALAGAF